MSGEVKLSRPQGCRWDGDRLPFPRYANCRTAITGACTEPNSGGMLPEIWAKICIHLENGHGLAVGVIARRDPNSHEASGSLIDCFARSGIVFASPRPLLAKVRQFRTKTENGLDRGFRSNEYLYPTLPTPSPWAEAFHHRLPRIH